ncbi:MAG: glycosyltransferase family 2 protein [Actinomycetes bacterium]
MTVPEVTVVVPVLDGAHLLTGCLDALAAQDDAPRYEVVVVDNGSTDGSADVARRHPVVDRVLVEPVPGSYAARNAGAGTARGRVLAFTDADCRPHPGWLRAGVDALVAADAAGGDVRAVLATAPTVWERYDRAVYLDQARAVRDERYAATANLFVHASAFAAAGPFDARLRSSGDLEWGQRAAVRGLTLVHAPAAVVDHVARRTARDTWRLHRRLGAGWRDLARDGCRPPAWREPALRVPLRWVAARVRDDGSPVALPAVAAVHATAMAARWVGRLAGDGPTRARRSGKVPG